MSLNKNVLHKLYVQNCYGNEENTKLLISQPLAIFDITSDLQVQLQAILYVYTSLTCR